MHHIFSKHTHEKNRIKKKHWFPIDRTTDIHFVSKSIANDAKQTVAEFHLRIVFTLTVFLFSFLSSLFLWKIGIRNVVHIHMPHVHQTQRHSNRFENEFSAYFHFVWHKVSNRKSKNRELSQPINKHKHKICVCEIHIYTHKLSRKISIFFFLLLRQKERKRAVFFRMSFKSLASSFISSNLTREQKATDDLKKM